MNRARNKRVREIAFRREQIEKMQIDLQLLQSRQINDQNGGKQPKAAALIARHAKSQVSCMWQEQAARQQRRREEAERDNVCLRLALERQQKAQRLENLIKKRSNQLTNECTFLMTMCCLRSSNVDVLDFCGDIQDFRGLFKRVEDDYRDVNVVIQANGLARSTISPNDVHMREGVDGKLLEFSFYKLLPYVQAAAESVWQHIKGVEKHLGVGSIYSKTAKNLDEPYTVIKDFSIEIYSNSSRANYKTKPVVGRYVEDDRDIVIWVLHATSVEVKHKLLSGLSYNLPLRSEQSLRLPGRSLSSFSCALESRWTKIIPRRTARTLVNFLILNAAKTLSPTAKVSRTTWSTVCSEGDCRDKFQLKKL
ncbi:hypothetical protein GN958_ATG19363 [Phytophthora infestans]|uniref:M96 mating-specific protein family n=1 Tax=Phytophthora infestans TaxID=4787 RepID=A0A8S9TX83_PHYIN|nr:hypothetical protein GN958_ATG19363 [Phytophthora infestans]